jgi:hypothetical protein
VYTEQLFRGLSLNKSAVELNTILRNDSTNYKMYFGKTGDPYYIALTNNDSFFYLVPLIINLQTHTTEIHLNITADKSNRSENGKLTYNFIVNLVKKDYEHYKQGC